MMTDTTGTIPSRTRRRMGVMINYLSLLLLLAGFYAIAGGALTAFFCVVGLVMLAVVIVTFYDVHIRTRIWRQTHAPADRLDERQIMVTHEALRLSYSWFTVICLALLVIAELIRGIAVDGGGVTFMPVVAGLIYLAHTLPGSILAWTEREI